MIKNVHCRIASGKAKFDGLEVSDAKRLKVLEDENAKLKKLYDDGAGDGSPASR